MTNVNQYGLHIPNLNIDLKQWNSHLETIHCAAYVIKNDANLTLVSGNSSFYKLFGCSINEMNYKYGNRLGALLDETSLKKFMELSQVAPTNCQTTNSIKLHIKHQGLDAWIYTEIVMSSGHFFCISFDITTCEQQQQSFKDYRRVLDFIIQQTKIDSFEYNCQNDIAKLYYTTAVFGKNFNGGQEYCPQFLTHLLSENFVYPEYKLLLQNALCDPTLTQERKVYELQVRSPQNTRIWVRLTLFAKAAIATDSFNIIGILEDITLQKESTSDYLNETQFYQSLLSENTAYAQVDATNDKITRIGGMWNLYNEILDKVTYSELINEFINKIVHPDDRKHYLELMQPSNFIESFNNGIDKLGCEFRRIADQNKMVWMQLSVHLFRNPSTKFVFALLRIKNIDALKKKEVLFQQNLALLESRNTAAPLSVTSPTLPKAEHLQEHNPFASFLDENGEIAYLVDVDTLEFLCGNKALYDRIGLTKEQCKGMKCYEVMQKRTTPCPFCSKANWATDKFYIWKNLNQSLEQEFLIKNKLVHWQDKEVMLALAIDISNDKSIVDSLENGATESATIISGIYHMVESETLLDSMTSILENIGSFFRADSVRFWYRKDHHSYSCDYIWSKNSSIDKTTGAKETIAWLNGTDLSQPINLENPEAMLCYSYEMFQYMKNYGIRNQRWIQIKDLNTIYGCIEIDNISSNFQNIAFLESLSFFIVAELKLRHLIDQASYLCKYDELTQLLNRRSFEDYLEAFKPEQISNVGVLMANFNNLKDINANNGFKTGNHYISIFADMLRNVFPTDPIFRLNGDEFLVITTDTSRTILDEKFAQLEMAIQHNGYFTVSLGHSWDNVENDLTTLINQATDAMRINKTRHHDSIPTTEDTKRRKMLSDLVRQLENKEFEVFLQPKVDLTNNAIVGAEALIRYRHPLQGILPPSQFIPLLEENNLIRYIDLFVFEEICKYQEKWKQQGLDPLVISLNFSRQTLQEHDILATVESIFSKYKIDKKLIEIEITESFANTGKSILYQTTRNLYEAGFLISLDDFGTKYTNLSILTDIKFNVLKLDRSLIVALGKHSNQRLVLKNIIQMCTDLGIDVIAEGIETKAQEKLLKELHCGFGQGYLYGKPMPISEFENLYHSIGCIK